MKILVAAIISLFSLATSPFADSWALPSTKEYFCKNRQYRLTVVPRNLTSQLAYFSDKASGKEDLPGQSESGSNHARGILAKMISEGEPVTLWETNLVNVVAPVSALVANDGRFVITFDNWQFMGRGDDVIVIYGTEGKLIRQYGLSDLMSGNDVLQLPQSVSSIWWGGEHSISDDGEHLVVQIVDPKDEDNLRFPPFNRPKTYIIKRIRLRDGEIVE